jgi:formylmethanofuran dehydrogenase subunit E
MRHIISFLKKLFTHNKCDTCGFTKEEVYLTELYVEAGLIQCKKCYNKNL